MPIRQRNTRVSPAILSSDTTVEVEERQVALWRGMTPAGKLRSAVGASDAVRQLSAAGSRFRHVSPAEAFLRFATLTLGWDRAREVYPNGVPAGARLDGGLNPVDVAVLVAQALEACSVRYVVGGSLASSVSGEPRATLDVDMMVALTEADIDCVLRGLGAEFHAVADSLRRAIRERSSANLIHTPTAVKIDLFIMGASPVDAPMMDRRRKIRLTEHPPAELYVYTPEDILLQKLRWFRLGREVSERQWRDVLGIVLVQGEQLDREYLRACAGELGVEDLLERAISRVQ